MAAAFVCLNDGPTDNRIADCYLWMAVQMTENPLDKIQTDPRPMPDFGIRFIEKGSPEGQLSWGERFYALVKPWAWHFTAALMVFIGFGAEYLHANIGKVEGKYGAWIASVVFGLTGLIRTYQLTQMLKREDTRQVEIK